MCLTLYISIIWVYYSVGYRYLIGDEVRARLGDKYFPAKIIEIQQNKLDPLKNKYYIHFGHVCDLLLFSF